MIFSTKKTNNKIAVFFFPNTFFPFNSAVSTRFVNIGYFLKKQNYDVYYLCRNVFKSANNSQVTDYGTLVGVNKKEYSKIFKLFFKSKIINSNISFLKNMFPEPDLLFTSALVENSYYPKKILNFYKDKKTKIVFSVMEHYSLKQFDNPLIQIRSAYCNNKFLRKFVSQRVYVMPISTYLSSFFEKRNVKNYVVPFIFDPDLIYEAKHKQSSKTIFLYSGMPFKKDNIFIALDGFAKLSKNELDKIEIHLVGVNEKYFRKHRRTNLLKFFKQYGCLYLHGKVPYNLLDKFYEMADFTFLMRNPQTTTSKAGFPTKVCESLFKGVPVVSNLTSDLGLYLINRKNAFVVKDYSAHAFYEAVLEILQLSDDEIDEMRLNARKTADTKLSTDVVLPNFLDYVNKN